MTKLQKARALFTILDCAPMGRSREQFYRYAQSGDVDGLWSFYQNAMAQRGDVRRTVEASDEVSFEMLKPAMETIYRLPTKD